MSTEVPHCVNHPRSSSCNVDWIHKYPQPLFNACTMSTVCKCYTVLPTAIIERAKCLPGKKHPLLKSKDYVVEPRLFNLWGFVDTKCH